MNKSLFWEKKTIWTVWQSTLYIYVKNGTAIFIFWSYTYSCVVLILFKYLHRIYYSVKWELLANNCKFKHLRPLGLVILRESVDSTSLEESVAVEEWKVIIRCVIIGE